MKLSSAFLRTRAVSAEASQTLAASTAGDGATVERLFTPILQFDGGYAMLLADSLRRAGNWPLFEAPNGATAQAGELTHARPAEIRCALP